MSNHKITDNLNALFDILPPGLSEPINSLGRNDDLIEVILDLGRVPTARFSQEELVLREKEISREDIAYVVQRVGEFDGDNRAGLERTLHRIAAIRNRSGDIVGLTCRVGRAVYGTTDIIKDFIESGKSLLLLGRPGVGKTTMLREAARILAEKKRVVIVDTSNEIGGDGDVPHPAVGKARRMQVASPSLQHEVMIEAVENHNPEVIVIDEIGRELEALAARTIAERGVQLIGTAHGNTLENLLINPTLADLVGGIESVTLSDEEARRRGTQKTVLERRSNPTFHTLIEIQTRDRLAIHEDVATAVDSLLRGEPLVPEIRSREESGEIKIRKKPQRARLKKTPAGLKRESAYQTPGVDKQARGDLETLSLFTYGIARDRMSKAARELEVPIDLKERVQDASVAVTLKHHYRNNPKPIMTAEDLGMPIYVLRSNTRKRMERFLKDVFNLKDSSLSEDEEEALEQTQGAIQAVLNGERWVELPPATSYIRRLQHQMVRQANLSSHSYGKDPNRRVRVFRDEE
ncbi:MAG: AAA family ATPase [Anaerolineales bacterium]|nr:AAA family ATPase [Anaerolineales bacterium]